MKPIGLPRGNFNSKHEEFRANYTHYQPLFKNEGKTGPEFHIPLVHEVEFVSGWDITEKSVAAETTFARERSSNLSLMVFNLYWFDNRSIRVSASITCHEMCHLAADPEEAEHGQKFNYFAKKIGRLTGFEISAYHNLRERPIYYWVCNVCNRTVKKTNRDTPDRSEHLRNCRKGVFINYQIDHPEKNLVTKDGLKCKSRCKRCQKEEIMETYQIINKTKLQCCCYTNINESIVKIWNYKNPKNNEVGSGINISEIHEKSVRYQLEIEKQRQIPALENPVKIYDVNYTCTNRVRGDFSYTPFAGWTTYHNDFVPFHFSKCLEDCIPAAECNATCSPELFCCQPDPPEAAPINYDSCPKYETCSVSLKPAAQFFPSDAKLDGLCTYKESYVPKALYPKLEWSKKSDPSAAKFDGPSTYRNGSGCREELVKLWKPQITFSDEKN